MYQRNGAIDIDIFLQPIHISFAARDVRDRRQSSLKCIIKQSPVSRVLCFVKALNLRLDHGLGLWVTIRP